MPTIITFAHSKGGVAKTTLALNMYRYYSESVGSCAIMDLDPQGSIAESYNEEMALDENEHWTNLNIIDVLPFLRGKSFEALKEREEKIIIVDTPPYLTDNLDAIVRISDLVVIPTRVGRFEGQAIQKTLNLINSAKGEDDFPKVAIVMSIVKTATKTWNKDFKKSIHKIGEYVCKTEIGDRVDFAREMLAAPYVLKEVNPKAYEQMQKLGDELTNYYLNQN